MKNEKRRNKEKKKNEKKRKIFMKTKTISQCDECFDGIFGFTLIRITKKVHDEIYHFVFRMKVLCVGNRSELIRLFQVLFARNGNLSMEQTCSSVLFYFENSVSPDLMYNNRQCIQSFGNFFMIIFRFLIMPFENPFVRRFCCICQTIE